MHDKLFCLLVSIILMVIAFPITLILIIANVAWNSSQVFMDYLQGNLTEEK